MADAYDVLQDLDWLKIPHSSLVLKYRFDDHGYVLMVSNLAAVFGEILDEKAVLERFELLNPFVEMLPKVILKNVKQIVKNIFQETKVNIVCGTEKIFIDHEVNNKGVPFMFMFQLDKLSENQFKAIILRPILLRTVILDEEKSALQRKIEELEGKQNSSSSRSSNRRIIKTLYSNLDHGCPEGSDVLEAFLYLQKYKIIVPESLKSTPNVSPMKGAHSSSTSFFPHKIKDLKKEATNIPYEEGGSDMTLEHQNITQQLEEPTTSFKMEKIGEEESSIKEGTSPSNLSAKKEEIPPKPALQPKSFCAKKRKLLRF